MREIIDFRVRPRFPETLKAWAPVPTEAFAPYVELYKMESRLSYLSVEEQLEEMDRHGISRAVLSGGDREENRFIAELCARHPDRFIGLGGVQAQHGATRAYRDAREALEELGLAGLNLCPCVQGIPADDPRNYPLYALCDDLDRLVVIHSSLHYVPHTPLELGNPRYFDRIAVDFPGMKIVMSHAGNGFGNVALAIAQRHTNVYLEFSALVPRYLPPPYIQAMNTYLRHKCLFATDYPLLDFTLHEQYPAVLREEVEPLFFAGNARRLLELDGAA